jgi:hypothetical protein
MNWIDFKQQKPTAEGEYLVYDGEMVRVDTWYVTRGQGYWTDTFPDGDPVLCWMAFPKPPNVK